MTDIINYDVETNNNTTNEQSDLVASKKKAHKRQISNSKDE